MLMLFKIVLQIEGQRIKTTIRKKIRKAFVKKIDFRDMKSALPSKKRFRSNSPLPLSSKREGYAPNHLRLIL
jgi:hypothetical protein